MSLIEAMMDDCVIMDKTTVADGEGGRLTTWKAGAEIKAAIIMDTSIEARIAEQQGVSNVYTITTEHKNALDINDVIKRTSDGLILRVTSSVKKSPAVSSLDMAQVTAEKWSLTND